MMTSHTMSFRAILTICAILFSGPSMALTFNVNTTADTVDADLTAGNDGGRQLGTGLGRESGSGIDARDRGT